MLKSDQNGIESFMLSEILFKLTGWNQTKMGLKDSCYCSCKNCKACWNQTKMGLKVFYFADELRDLFKVEIRPKWDWKIGGEDFGISSAVELKSDQNGIESAKISGRKNQRGKSWNQTKMGLKVRIKSELRVTYFKVEIRPKWDWKEDLDEIYWESCDVEIRPKWDWKQPYQAITAVSRDELKSDQNGIESCIMWRLIYT